MGSALVKLRKNGARLGVNIDELGRLRQGFGNRRGGNALQTRLIINYVFEIADNVVNGLHFSGYSEV